MKRTVSGITASVVHRMTVRTTQFSALDNSTFIILTISIEAFMVVSNVLRLGDTKNHNEAGTTNQARLAKFSSTPLRVGCYIARDLQTCIMQPEMSLKKWDGKACSISDLTERKLYHFLGPWHTLWTTASRYTECVDDMFSARILVLKGKCILLAYFINLKIGKASSSWSLYGVLFGIRILVETV